MSFQHVKICMLASALALGSVGVAVAAPGDTTGAANNGMANPAYTTTRNDDRGFDWGWLGLIGLAGLAGLMKKDRNVRTETTSRDYVAPGNSRS